MTIVPEPTDTPEEPKCPNCGVAFDGDPIECNDCGAELCDDCCDDHGDVCAGEPPEDDEVDV